MYITEILTIALMGTAGGFVVLAVLFLLFASTKRVRLALGAFVGAVASAGLLAFTTSGRFGNFADVALLAIVADFLRAGLVYGLGMLLAFLVVAGSAAACLVWPGKFRAPVILLGVCLSFSVLGNVALTALSPGTASPFRKTLADAQQTLAALPSIRVPAGFRVDALWDHTAIAGLAYDDTGALYASDRIRGEIYRLIETDQGVQVSTYATDMEAPLGLAWHNGWLYVAEIGNIAALQDANGDGRADEKKPVVTDIPVVHWVHRNHAVAVSPDGYLFFTVGAPEGYRIREHDGVLYFNDQPMHPWLGTVLRSRLGGSDVEVWARGLRNSYGLTFSPSGDLWATDPGESDAQGQVTPWGGSPGSGGDELNLILRGGDYGHPWIQGFPPPGSNTVSPVVVFRTYSTPVGLTFYKGSAFPEAWRDRLYVAIYSSAAETIRDRFAEAVGEKYWVGSKIVSIDLQPATGEAGWLGIPTDFATGFNYPLAVVESPDGALIVADSNGLFKISAVPAP